MAPRPELLEQFVQEWFATPRKGRRAVVARCALAFGVGEARAYALMQAHRATLGGEPRKRRASKISDDQIRAVAGLAVQSIDNYGKCKLSVVDQKEIATLNQILPPDLQISTATLRRRLDALQLSRRFLEASTPSVNRISTHPNQVHVVDFTPGLQWWIRDDGQVEFHKTPLYKPEHFEGRRHLWLYALTDHRTGAFFVRYYYSKGENPTDLVEFLYRCWAPKEHRSYPLHGVPDIVLADQGAPFKRTAVQNLLRHLGVKLELHSPGNAKASGAVETLHNHWQSRFDTRTKLQPVLTLSHLNQLALELCIRINTLDIHSRHGQTRSGMWSAEMAPRTVRVPPAEAAFRLLAHETEATRRVNNYLQISIENVVYQLAGTVVPGETVTFIQHPFSAGLIRVWTPRKEELTVTRCEKDAAGFVLSPRSAVFGSGEFTRHPDTAAQRLTREVEANPIQIGDAFGHALEGIEDIHFLPPRRVEPAVAVEALPVLRVGAEEVRWRAALAFRARGWALTPDEGDALDAAVGEGIPEDQVTGVIAQLRTEEEAPQRAFRTA